MLPTDRSAFVTEPAAHAEHAEVDTLLNCPAEHAVHVVPLSADSVSVTAPAAHDEHTDVDTALYIPAIQAVQLVPPVDASVSVIEPATHATLLR